MKMSNGQIGRRLLGLAVAGMALVSGGTSFAAQPQPWEVTLQPAASPVMENIVWFHNFLFVLITAPLSDARCMARRILPSSE